MSLFRAGAILAFFLALVFVNQAVGQSLLDGDISGQVTDPTGSVVPNAVISLKSLDTGTKQTAKSSGDGLYRFTLLKPGHYEVSTTVAGFANDVRKVLVEVGQTTEVDFKLEISKTTEAIEVSAAVPLISTDPGITTVFTPTEVALLPAAGGDITTIAFTAPGVVVAPGTGAGNFTANGLPATSNLFTVNGENDMDPYDNVNSSGATNLTLGANELQEATVISNPYSGQYGQLMGAQVIYVTKSGTNQFHGNAQYWWNGRFLNADNWINNATGGTRPFANANQWAASFGGPFWKEKAWFFLDTEGLRFILPNVFIITVPTPAFASAVLANIHATQPKQVQAYESMLNLWATAAQGHAPSISPTQSEGCVAGVVPGWLAGAPCSEEVTVTPSALAKEWILAGRADFKLGPKDQAFFRFKLDHGVQPTYLDPVSPNFDALSNQPSYDFQAQERHVFNTNMTNAFMATLSHYIVQFQQNAALVKSTFPYALSFGTNVNFTAFNPAENFPEGRNITQYQFIDDFTWTKGRHFLQFGVNFRRYDVSDHNFLLNSPFVLFQNISTPGAGLDNGLQDFADGIAYLFVQADNQASSVPIALWGMGMYASDTWKVKPTLSLMLALRVERNSNPVCQHNCFANFTGSFSSLASVQAENSGGDPGDVPYSSDIKYNQHQAYPGVDALVWSPRVAFSWAPAKHNHFPWCPGSGKTVLGGGVGLFYDNPAAGIVDGLLGNPPVSVVFLVQPPTGTYPFDTTATGAAATFTRASAAFNISKSYNQIEQELAALNVVFPAPAFAAIEGRLHAPQAQEWNLKVDQEINRTTAISVNYTGNHVIHLLYNNSWANAYDCCGVFSGVPGVNESPVVPNYGPVTTTQSGAVANYDGVTISLREQYRTSFLAHVNYTFSHTLDEVSNGGVFPYSPNSLLGQNNPAGLRPGNYGNAEYDIRHLFSADFVISPSFHFENRLLKGLFGGWQTAGKVFVRSGFPFSVVDGNLTGVIINGGGNILANQISAAAQTSCGRGNVFTSGVGCINSNAFTNTGSTSFTGYSTWPNQERNQFRGTGYFDIDLSLVKTFQIRERVSLGVGMTAYNALNHPNFGQPDNILGDGTTGQIFKMQGVPTSPYGGGLGFDSSPRVVQLTTKLNF
jgi:Carboxypeptidase regulatory-like domain